MSCATGEPAGLAPPTASPPRPSLVQAALWGAKLLCYGLPGNPHSADAARWLVPLADAAAGGRQPQPQLVDMADLGGWCWGWVAVIDMEGRWSALAA